MSWLAFKKEAPKRGAFYYSKKHGSLVTTVFVIRMLNFSV